LTAIPDMVHTSMARLATTLTVRYFFSHCF
jgi:hypothetical protein